MATQATITQRANVLTLQDSLFRVIRQLDSFLSTIPLQAPPTSPCTSPNSSVSTPSLDSASFSDESIFFDPNSNWTEGPLDFPNSHYHTGIDIDFDIPMDSYDLGFDITSLSLADTSSSSTPSSSSCETPPPDWSSSSTDFMDTQLPPLPDFMNTSYTLNSQSHHDDPIPLTPEEEDYYEFITHTTELDEWSQKILEACYIPHNKTYSSHILGHRDGLIMWGMLLWQFLAYGWLTYYRTKLVKPTPDSVLGDTTDSEEEVQVKVYQLSLAGRQFLAFSLSLRKIPRDELGEYLVRLGSEMKITHETMEALDRGPPQE